MVDWPNLFVCVLISSAHGFWYPDRRNEVGLKDDDCRKVGTQCSADCKKIIYCRQVGGTAIEVDTCSGNLLCNVNNNTCTAQKCDVLPINKEPWCSGPETWMPDFYNCTKSYYCNKQGLPGLECTCSSDQYYNPESNNCEPKNAQCCWDGKVHCTSMADSGFLGDGTCFKSVCYTCINNNGALQAVIDECPKGTTHKDVNHISMPFKFSRAISDKNTKGQGTCHDYDPNTTPPTPPHCNQPGEMIRDPDDCHSYYKCDANLNPINYTCPGGTHFECLSPSNCGCTPPDC